MDTKDTYNNINSISIFILSLFSLLPQWFNHQLRIVIQDHGHISCLVKELQLEVFSGDDYLVALCVDEGQATILIGD